MGYESIGNIERRSLKRRNDLLNRANKYKDIEMAKEQNNMVLQQFKNSLFDECDVSDLNEKRELERLIEDEMLQKIRKDEEEKLAEQYLQELEEEEAHQMAIYEEYLNKSNFNSAEQDSTVPC